MKYTIIIAFLTSILFTGCLNTFTPEQKYNTTTHTNHIHNSLHTAISDISSQLFKTTNKDLLKDNLVVTSFVLLDNLKDTSKFGRLLGESMISELHSKGFKVSDFRGRDAILVNKNGEFYITRDTKKLKDEMSNANILVGTYSNFDQHSMLVNVRIMNFDTGEVISAAKIVYTSDNCALLETCVKSAQMKIIEDK